MKLNPHNKIREQKAVNNFQITRIKNEIKFIYTKKQHLINYYIDYISITQLNGVAYGTYYTRILKLQFNKK
jgi:hypothetical protein